MQKYISAYETYFKTGPFTLFDGTRITLSWLAWLETLESHNLYQIGDDGNLYYQF